MNTADIIRNAINNGKSPRELVFQLLGNQFNPMIKNLVEMAEKGEYQSVENFTRNVFKEQGRNFDKEVQDMQTFINQLKK